MKTKALKAWLKSLPLALLVPALILLGYLMCRRLVTEYWTIIPCYTMTVHLAAYLVTGLPLFLVFYHQPGVPLWKFPIAILTGMLIGGLSFSVIFNSWSLYSLGAGTAYGFVTAIAAWLQRPRNHENAHHLP